MTIAGDPAPPHDVHGEIDVYDEEGNLIVLQQGDDV